MSYIHPHTNKAILIQNERLDNIEKKIDQLQNMILKLVPEDNTERYDIQLDKLVKNNQSNYKRAIIDDNV